MYISRESEEYKTSYIIQIKIIKVKVATAEY